MNPALKLVVIDDNPNDADRILSTIKSVGVAVRSNVVRNKQELENCLQQEFEPHIVLLSLSAVSSNMDEVLRVVRKYTEHTPVFLLFEEEADISSLYKCGVQCFIEKSDQEHLIAEVTKTFALHSHIDKLEQIANSYDELEKRCHSLLDSSRDAICYVHEGLHTYTNQSYLEFFEISDPDEATGISFLEFVAKEDQEKVKSIFKTVRKDLQSGVVSLQIKLPSGSSEEKSVEYSPIVVDGETCIQIIIRTDLVQSSELQEQLSYLTERDTHTGFFHRRSIFDKLETALEEAKTQEKYTTFLQVDIVNFHELRDQYGLPVIDQLATHVAEKVRTICDANDTIAKLTEESFGILTEQTECGKLREFAENIKDALENDTLKINGQPVHPECYIGAVKIDTSMDSVNMVLAASKSACDQAWELQSKDFEIYEPDMTEAGGTLLDERWSIELREAISENRFKLLFQPIISMTGDQNNRYQVYTQLISKEGAAISVAELLPSVERTGVSVLLDRWIIENALQALSTYLQKHKKGTFFVKLTSGSIHDEKLLDWVSEQMKKYSVPANSFVVEIQEEIVVANLKECKDLSSKLQKLGCGISIDAFGINSNKDEPTKLLSMISADYVKLSYRLINGINEGISDVQELAQTICTELNGTGTKAIAQHIESAEMLSKVWPLGVELVCGEFFQAPTDSLEYDFSSAA